MRRAGEVAALVLLLVGASARADEPPPLPIATTAAGRVRRDAPVVYRFDAPSAGLITTAVQVEGEGDLVLFVCDDDGQPLADLVGGDGQPFPGGRSDRDLLGSAGVEALTLLAPAPGRYLVVVEVAAVGGVDEARFAITGAFAPLAGLARPADPDGKPSGATPVDVGGQPHQVEDAVAPKEHDLRDWFALRCQRAGTLKVVVRAGDGDLRLDAHAPTNLRTPIATSDDDEQGVAGNESVSIPVQQGQVVLVRVAAVFAAADRIAYRVVTAITD